MAGKGKGEELTGTRRIREESEGGMAGEEIHWPAMKQCIVPGVFLVYPGCSFIISENRFDI